MKKSTKCILATVGISVAAIYAYNKYTEINATSKNLLTNENGDYFTWNDYQIFYTKSGSGSPILLVHDADATSSGTEWSKIIHRLEKNHTVYCIDLLGCGRSNKPALEYTNYLYVQIISNFIKEVIGEKTNVVSTNMSASFIVMANHMDDTLFEKIILINPVSLKQMDIIPDKLTKLKKRIIELPFIGTFIYNLMTNPTRIDTAFRDCYYAKPQLISHKLEDAYYEAAHLDGSNGRYLYSSILGNYVNNTITHAIKKLEAPTLIIGCKELKKYEHILDDYHNVNSTLEIMRINNGSLYPQLEIPEKITSIIEEYL